MSLIAFFDLEINPEKKKILGIGAIGSDDEVFHKSHPDEFLVFVEQSRFLCGRNILAHDLQYLQKYKSDPTLGLDKALTPFYCHPCSFLKTLIIVC